MDVKESLDASRSKVPTINNALRLWDEAVAEVSRDLNVEVGLVLSVTSDDEPDVETGFGFNELVRPKNMSLHVASVENGMTVEQRRIGSITFNYDLEQWEIQIGHFNWETGTPEFCIAQLHAYIATLEFLFIIESMTA